MMELLGSKKATLAAAIINGVCAGVAALSGSWVWFGISVGLAAFCYYHYIQD